MNIEKFGAWESLVTPEMMSKGNVGLAEPKSSAEAIYWLESRPWEKGRSVLIESRGDKQKDMFPEGYSARSAAQEYGGGAWTLADQYAVFVNAENQVIYRIDLNNPDTPPVALSTQDGRRYGDLYHDPGHDRVLAICEDHRVNGKEPRTSIVSISLQPDREVIELVGGADFYAYPRVSPDGKKLCWIAWNHPHMPWQATQLVVADLDKNGQITSSTCLIEETEIAVFQPDWSPDGELVFVADFDEFWNLYRWNEESGIEALTQLQAECGLAFWNYGMSTWGFVPDGILCCINEMGSWRLAKVAMDGSMELLDLPFTHLGALKTLGNSAVMLAASPIEASTLIEVDTRSGEFKRIYSSASMELPVEAISRPLNVDFPSGNDSTAHAFFYPPKNPDFQGPQGEKPPLVVLCHGGPTSATSSALNLKVQFWTSRGFAVMDVNYRGSTGYGKSYRQALQGQWGVADVEDACKAAEYAAAQGWVDPDKLIIRGSSAGGFTVLAALTFGSTFTAGCCIYGIGDLKALAEETHKFESRYLDGLIAPWPEGEAEYHKRSPLNHSDQLSCPVIFFQGLRDKVVPPEQTQSMARALQKRGIPTWFQTYAEEGHGFRQAESIVDSYQRELAFYSQIFDFPNSTDIKLDLTQKIP